MAVVANKVLIVGLGQIGASLARVLREKGAVNEFLGVSRSDSTISRALELGVVDRASNDLAAMASELEAGDVIVLATPVLTFEKLFGLMADAAERGVLITDGGSVKGEVVEAAKRAWGQLPAGFVPEHPSQPLLHLLRPKEL